MKFFASSSQSPRATVILFNTKSSILILELICVITVLREFCSLIDSPEGVQLQVSEETVCIGANIIFNCSTTDANPMELTYHLYENDVMVINSSSTGIWNRTMTTEGVFGYSCKVTNIVETTMSLNVTITVSGKHGTFLTNRKVPFYVKHTLFAVQCF